MRVERIVETVPDASNPLGKVTHIVERYHYTKAEIAVMKSRQAFKGASVAAATLLQASLTSPEIAKSAEGTTATCDALAKALIWKIAYLTVKPLEADYFFGLSQPQTIERLRAILAAERCRRDPLSKLRWHFGMHPRA